MKIPEPHTGLVIRYEYLWHNESLKGSESGRKGRPCAIIVILHDSRVMVVPITHTQPEDAACAVEIPLTTKARLGLDSERSWAICSEVNEFQWPGPDLQPATGKDDTCAYGTLPQIIIDRIASKIHFLARGRKLKVVARSE